ncbi:MAG: Rrf2 family transcriptional regulator [Polyangiaceae bacterium]|nr:Rrf2 family transcriptional regulator [Polyangiaceae bacterium]NUQ75360.1 Rrf2 family transcriptional regulator [Polyangiaceae bacterium]
MHLTLHADYSLRVLLYLSAHPGRQVSTGEISDAYGISKNHLVRVVHELGRLGYLDVRPGRSGGLSLARSPSQIRVGDVIREMEPHMNLLECFNPAENTCPILPACALKSVLEEARDAFLAVLDKLTLADVIRQSSPNLPAFFLTKSLVRTAR